MSSRTCAVEDCPKAHYARGYCNYHYVKQRRIEGIGAAATCTECDKPAIAKGLCSTHYARVQRLGSVELPEDTTIRECTVCGQPTVGRGLCQTHYKRMRKYGSTDRRRSDPKTRVEKTCPRCEVIKPLDEFYISRSTADGHVSVCKACKRRPPKPDPRLRTEKPCTKCRVVKPLDEFGIDNTLLDGRTTRCTECRRGESRAFEKANREARNAKNRVYYDENREAVLARAKKVRLADPEKANAPGRRWAAANRDKVAEKAERRRVKKKGFDSALVRAKDIKRIYDSPCAHCGERGNIHMDHVIPLSRGGRHSVGNLQPLCASCNLEKGSRLEVEWRYLARPKRRPRAKS